MLLFDQEEKLKNPYFFTKKKKSSKTEKSLIFALAEKMC